MMPKPVIIDPCRFVQAFGDDLVVISVSKLGSGQLFVASVRYADGTSEHYPYLRPETTPAYFYFCVPIRPGVHFFFDESLHDLRRVGSREAFAAIHEMTAARLCVPSEIDKAARHPFEVVEGGKG